MISSRHAEIVVGAQNRFRINDLARATARDKRQQIASVELVDGDNIRLGRTTFRFKTKNLGGLSMVNGVNGRNEVTGRQAVGFVRAGGALALASFSWHRRRNGQNAKLRYGALCFDSLPDIKLYLTYVEEDGTVIAGRAATDFKLQRFRRRRPGGQTKAVATFDQINRSSSSASPRSPAAVQRWLAEIKSGFRKINEAVA